MYIPEAAFIYAAHLVRKDMKREHERRQAAAELDGSPGVSPMSEYLKIRVTAPDQGGLGLTHSFSDIHMG